MKATAKCPECGETITTDCRGCIEGNVYECSEHGEKIHNCNCEVISNVKWKKVPENEKELMEVEEI